MGDFNGDGQLDLAIANSRRQRVGVLLGNGDGTFQAQVDYAAGLGPALGGGGRLQRRRQARPGRRQLGSGNVSVLLGNGDGTFQAQVAYAAGIGPVRRRGGRLQRRRPARPASPQALDGEHA